MSPEAGWKKAIVLSPETPKGIEWVLGEEWWGQQEENSAHFTPPYPPPYTSRTLPQ